MTIYPDKYCVYLHKKGRTIFYVGSGVSTRPFTNQGRSEAWHSYVKEHGGHYTVEVVAWFKDLGEARLFEGKEIERLKPLTNLGWLSPYWRSKKMPPKSVRWTRADQQLLRRLEKRLA